MSSSSRDATSPTQPLFACRDITVWRNDELILNRVSFELSRGQALLVTGHNGSGKTTLLRVLASLRHADEGSVELNGDAPAVNRQLWASTVAYCGHQNGLSDTLSVRENLAFVSACCSTRPDSTRVDIALERMALSAISDRQLGRLSAGQKRRAALASLLVRDACVWLLDEPFTAIDSDGRHVIENIILEHMDNKGTCILSSHQDLVSPQLLSRLRQLNLQRPQQPAL